MRQPGLAARDQRGASGNINVVGNKTHLSNAAAVPTTAEGQRQQCYKAKKRNGYTLSVGNRIHIQTEINNTRENEKRDQ